MKVKKETGQKAEGKRLKAESSMICQKCKKNPANVNFKGVFNDEVVKMALCEDCARKTGLVLGFGQGGADLGAFGFPWEKPGASLAEWITALTDPAGLTPSITAPTTTRALKCNSCGLSYAAFKDDGRLGCDNCYTAFAAYLGPLLKRIHGSDFHAGKAYRQSKKAQGEAVRNTGKNLEQLRAALEKAIKSEEYERAAQIRDEIRKITGAGGAK